MKVVLILLVAFIVTPALPTEARGIYVAQSKSASDDNVGTRDDPLRSIGFAVSLAEPGDIVFVGPGDYRNEDTGFGPGVIPVLNSGTAKRPLIIRARTQARPVVGSFFLKQCSNVVVKGFRVTGLDFDSVEDWQPMPTIVRDIDPKLPRPDFTADFETRRDQIEREYSTYFQLVNDLGFDIGIDIENCQSIIVSQNVVSGYFAGIQCRGAKHVKIFDNRISECVNGIFTFGLSDNDVPSLNEGQITYNTIEQCLDNGIDIRAGARNILIRLNRIFLNGRSHISLQGGTSNSTVAWNTVRDGGYYSETMEFPGSSGISLNDVGDDNVVVGNRVSRQIDLTGIDGNGIILDFLQDGATASVVNNRSAQNMGAGLNLTDSPGNHIARNLFLSNGVGATERRQGCGIKISRDSDVDNVIVGNVFGFNRVAGILSSDTIVQQQNVDRNLYLTSGEALIWDGYDDGERQYFTLRDVQENTSWETSGTEFFFLER